MTFTQYTPGTEVEAELVSIRRSPKIQRKAGPHGEMQEEQCTVLTFEFKPLRAIAGELPPNPRTVFIHKTISQAQLSNRWWHDFTARKCQCQPSTDGREFDKLLLAEDRRHRIYVEQPKPGFESRINWNFSNRKLEPTEVVTPESLKAAATANAETPKPRKARKA